ncbi:MAG: glycosyltransferase family 39 protein [Candidatus Blackburnbacteria bacterium]|nr:glycosyltransferase family 39 protein [Candidatus Blackburnbacteria bacterium]
MSKKLFWLLFILILIFAYILRIIPIQNNNFFFTIDQGDDAVHARELFDRGQILFKGPMTGISGIYTGPGWYYFISVGYKLFGGHPFGALFMVILLSLATTALLIWQIGKKVSPKAGLLVGIALQGFWFFYDTSRWAFNPFPLVFLSVVLILLLISFLEGNKKSYFLAFIPIGLAFNTEVAGAAAMFVFYFLVGLWGVKNGRLLWKTLILSNFFFPILFLAGIPKQVFTLVHFDQGSALGTFSGTNFSTVTQAFLEIIRDSLIPQSLVLSIFLFGVLLIWLKQKKDDFTKKFVSLTLALFAVSYLFFSANKGWQDWHDPYLPPLLFTSTLLILFSKPWKIGLPIFFLVMASQLLVFKQRYTEYLHPSNDPGILASKISVVDWVYKNAENDGFNVYIYMPSFYDYPYQYLFWWYGRKVYKYVPCEYSNYPASLKYLYVPGSEHYSTPTLGCDKFRFLVIEEGGNLEKQQKQLKLMQEGTKLVEETMIGKIKVEKRIVVRNR